jgi:ATP-dependent Lhr-like helicase
MGVALRFPAFPITLETYREVLRDVFDLPALLDVLRQIRSRAIRIEPAVTESASPFARSLVFDYVAAFLYEGDAPLAERKAQALTLDRNLLRELIGGGELRDLLDPDVLTEVEMELQQLVEGRKARTIDEVHDVLRRLGDLDRDEILARSEHVEIDSAIEQLVLSGRAARVRIASKDRVIAAEDAARYRDGLGINLPKGLPAALLERAEAPMESLVTRWARTHAPFTAEHPGARWGMPAAQIEPILALLEARGQLVRGELRPGGMGLDSCDPEVLRQLRRRTLAKLRAQVAPVGSSAYAAFLPRWHGLDQPRRGTLALRDAIARLEGVALSFQELESRILPARILDYHPRMLDELGAAGELTWVGAGALGTKDGRVMLLRRERARELAPEPTEIANRSAVHDAIVEHLRKAGASFLVAIEQAAAGAGRAAVTAALWDLVWAGVITNDTFAPLRSLATPNTRRTSAHASFGGRWSLVESLGPAPTATARAHAQATALLERWGIASRNGARSDELPGGFATVGDVLRAMEDAGTVRRGYFVEHLEGAQFAWPGAIDRLREAPRGQASRVDVLAAIDPANAWGSALPWPELCDPDARPARRSGASAILVDGALAVWLEPKGRRIATAAALPAEAIELACAVGLPRVAARHRRRELLIEMINGEAAGSSPLARGLIAAGARVDYRGLVVRGTVTPVLPEPEPEDAPEDDEVDA